MAGSWMSAFVGSTLFFFSLFVLDPRFSSSYYILHICTLYVEAVVPFILLIGDCRPLGSSSGKRASGVSYGSIKAILWRYYEAPGWRRVITAISKFTSLTKQWRYIIHIKQRCSESICYCPWATLCPSASCSSFKRNGMLFG